MNYGIKDVPNVIIVAIDYDNNRSEFHCLDLDSFTFENIYDRIECTISLSVFSESFLTDLICNDNRRYSKFLVTAVTNRRSAETGKDEEFTLLDNYRFDKMNIEYELEASGEPAHPIITLVRYL